MRVAGYVWHTGRAFCINEQGGRGEAKANMHALWGEFFSIQGGCR